MARAADRSLAPIYMHLRASPSPVQPYAMASSKRRRATTCTAPETPIVWKLPADLILEIVARSDRVSLIRSAAVPSHPLPFLHPPTLHPRLPPHILRQASHPSPPVYHRCHVLLPRPPLAPHGTQGREPPRQVRARGIPPRPGPLPPPEHTEPAQVPSAAATCACTTS
jgi:hypothetical protein